VLVGDGDLGELGGHLLDGARPQTAGVAEHVGLVDQREVPARAGDRPLEGVADDALDTEGGVERHLGGDLVRGVLAQDAAVADVGALGALADAQHVDRAGVGEGAGHAVEEPGRPQVDVVVELEPQPQQQPPLEDARRDARVTDRAEQDRVVAAELLEHRVRQQLAGALPPCSAEVVLGALDVGSHLAEDLEGLRDDLGADAVSRDHCQAHGHEP
jgi:hypothetical protein